MPEKVYRAAITIFDLGYNYEREIGILGNMGVRADYLPLEGTQDEDTVISALTGYDFVLAGSEKWGAKAFEALSPNLKLVVRLGTGLDSVDLHAASECGVLVCNAPGGNACSVAQHALGLMLDLARSISRYDRYVKEDLPIRKVMAEDIIGKTVGLLGFGAIARELAKLLSGFSCEILAYDIRWNDEAARALQVQYAGPDELAAKSDYLSVHLPLLPATRGMIGREMLWQMKPSAYLINTSRSGVICEDELVEALICGRIAGAGLDVWEKRPFGEANSFAKLENVVLTPYVAFSGRLGNERTADLAIGSIDDFLNRRPVRNQVNLNAKNGASL